MSDNQVDTIVIGAGVVGLAIARELTQRKRDVIVIEKEDIFGSITSTRNSGVIHAGIYYDAGTMKAKLCARGNRALYAYCEKKNIPHLNVGKFVVATSKDEASKLESIYNKAAENNVVGISRVSKEYVNNKEPLVICHEALEVTSTGIVDQQSLMRSYIGDFEDNGGMIAYNTKIISIESIGDKFKIITNDKTEIIANSIINAAGLEAHNIAKLINGFNQKFIPKIYYAKGNYFETNKKLGIKHLIYPVPTEASLGLHLGLDMSMQMRFGPDVEWVNEINYTVDPNRIDLFHEDIIKYLPDIKKEDLHPGYSGVRPKLKGKGEGKSDFMIQSSKEHGMENLVNLFGMESPGLTSSLVIADYVADLIE
jgi:L-2-hydroxyglutarate oxidase LhgO